MTGDMFPTQADVDSARREGYEAGAYDARTKIFEQPDLNNWNGRPLASMSQGELIDALRWCWKNMILG